VFSPIFLEHDWLASLILTIAKGNT